MCNPEVASPLRVVFERQVRAATAKPLFGLGGVGYLGHQLSTYVHDIVDVGGLRFPTKRLAYVRGPNRKPIRDLLLVSIDLSNFRLTN